MQLGRHAPALGLLGDQRPEAALTTLGLETVEHAIEGLGQPRHLGLRPERGQAATGVERIDRVHQPRQPRQRRERSPHQHEVDRQQDGEAPSKGDHPPVGGLDHQHDACSEQDGGVRHEQAPEQRDERRRRPRGARQHQLHRQMTLARLVVLRTRLGGSALSTFGARDHTLDFMAPLLKTLDDPEALVLRHRRLARHLAQRYVRGGESARGPRAGRLPRPRQGRAALRPGSRCRVHDVRRADDPRRTAPLLPRHALGRARPATDPGARAGAAPDRGCSPQHARARTERQRGRSASRLVRGGGDRSPCRRGWPEPTVAQRRRRSRPTESSAKRSTASAKRIRASRVPNGETNCSARLRT